MNSGFHSQDNHGDKIKLDVHFIVPFVSLDDPGSGNPAAVCIVAGDQPISFATMSNISRELGQPETIFAKFRSPGHWDIRNYTPGGQRIIPGGNGIPALAWLLLNELDNQQETVYMNCEYPWMETTAKLSVDGRIAVTLPSVMPYPMHDNENRFVIQTALNISPSRCYRGRRDAILLYDNVEDLQALNFELLMQAKFSEELPFVAVIASAPREDGFAYRTCVLQGVDSFECPGSFTALANLPALYDSLGYHQTTLLHAEQLSIRGGEAWCELIDNGLVRLTAECERRCGPASFSFPVMGDELDFETGQSNDTFIWI